MRREASTTAAAAATFVVVVDVIITVDVGIIGFFTAVENHYVTTLSSTSSRHLENLRNIASRVVCRGAGGVTCFELVALNARSSLWRRTLVASASDNLMVITVRRVA